MTTTEQALLIILSIFLAIFLLISIIALAKIIQILKYIRHIMEKAEKIADKADTVADFFEKSAGTAAITKLVSNIVQVFKSDKDKGGND